MLRRQRPASHRRWWLPTVAYAASGLAFRREPVRIEDALFTRINDAPDWRWLRVPQQLGTPWVLPAVGVWSWLGGRPRDAVLAGLALPTVKGAEVATKFLLRRPRPLYTTPTELRDDAPVEGPSFPSGHTALATCAVMMVTSRSSRPVAVGLVLGPTLLVSAYVRVHQGAHHPSDTLGGLLLGWAVAWGLDEAMPRASRG